MAFTGNWQVPSLDMLRVAVQDVDVQLRIHQGGANKVSWASVEARSLRTLLSKARRNAPRLLILASLT